MWQQNIATFVKVKLCGNNIGSVYFPIIKPLGVKKWRPYVEPIPFHMSECLLVVWHPLWDVRIWNPCRGSSQKIFKHSWVWSKSAQWQSYIILRCAIPVVCLRWGKFSQKHNYEYMARWRYLLAIENYMFRPKAAITRFWQFSCYKSYIYIYII